MANMVQTPSMLAVAQEVERHVEVPGRHEREVLAERANYPGGYRRVGGHLTTFGIGRHLIKPEVIAQWRRFGGDLTALGTEYHGQRGRGCHGSSEEEHKQQPARALHSGRP